MFRKWIVLCLVVLTVGFLPGCGGGGEVISQYRTVDVRFDWESAYQQGSADPHQAFDAVVTTAWTEPGGIQNGESFTLLRPDPNHTGAGVVFYHAVLPLGRQATILVSLRNSGSTVASKTGTLTATSNSPAEIRLRNSDPYILP